VAQVEELLLCPCLPDLETQHPEVKPQSNKNIFNQLKVNEILKIHEDGE
jgi:hypothetical protein